MDKLKYSIIPYQPAYEPALMELERSSPQGGWVQLELVKENFLTRSTVFDQYAIFLSVDENGRLIAVYSAAIATLKVGEKRFRAGIPFDVRVDPAYRNQGIAKKMLRHIWKHFFHPNGVTEIFTTMKSSNVAVLKVAQTLQRKAYQYPFVYLTIPTYHRLYLRNQLTKDQQFFVRFFGPAARLQDYYQNLGDGLGVWKTHKMYQIRLNKIAGVLRAGIKLINFFRSARKQLPVQGDVLRFNLLYDFNPGNLAGLNEAFATWEKNGINYLSVCCHKGDEVYRQLKPIAINAYRYLLLSSIPIRPEDKVEIDVRCL